MTNKLIRHGVALAAAALTTLALFSAVIGIAEEDKAALAAAKSTALVASAETRSHAP